MPAVGELRYEPGGAVREWRRYAGHTWTAGSPRALARRGVAVPLPDRPRIVVIPACHAIAGIAGHEGACANTKNSLGDPGSAAHHPGWPHPMPARALIDGFFAQTGLSIEPEPP